MSFPGSRAILTALLAWLILGSTAVSRAETTYNIATDPNANVTVRLATPLTAVPGFGYMPLRIFVENKSGRDGAWQFRFRNGLGQQFPGALSAETEVTVPSLQNREVWFYLPVASAGVNSMPGAAGAPAAAAPAGGAISVTTAIANLAREKLDLAGLGNPPGTVSVTTTPGGTGASQVTVVIRQVAPAASLPRPATAQVPPGFTVAWSDAGGGDAERTFTYLDSVPTVLLGGRLTPANIEEATRALLAPTGLLLVPGSITSTVTTASAVTASAATLIVFVQTGPESAFPPVPGGLPAGVTVVRHPGPSPGGITRTISYLDPVSAATLTPATLPMALDLTRLNLIRYGYLRGQPGVQTSGDAQGPAGVATLVPGPRGGVTIRASGGGGATVGRGGRGGRGANPSMRVSITETGPTDLLPAIDPARLPRDVIVSLTPNGSGQVARRYDVTVFPPTARLVPSPSISTRIAASDLYVEMTGPGLSSNQRHQLAASLANGVAATPPLAVSSALEQPLRSKLALAGVSGAPSVAAVDPAILPADWRVWSSFHGVILRAPEFEALDSARQAALRAWMTLGGQLTLVPEVAAAGTPTRRERFGAGSLTTLGSAINDLDTTSLGADLQLASLALSLPEAATLAQFTPGSPFGRFLEALQSNPIWVATFIVLFTAAIGPVNLYWFAPLRRRYRLFVTTPLLALGGSVVLVIMILFQDGVGGSGVRDAIVVLVPGDNAAAVMQVQASRTGLLGSGRFELPEDTLISGIPIANFSAGARSSNLTRGSREAGGDWFRGRWRQAHFLERVVPTRGRVERVSTAPDGSPVVESTFGAPLREFLYSDASGRSWTAESVPPGRPITLVRAGTNAWSTEWVEAHFTGSAHLARLLLALTPREAGRWVALGEESELAPIATLGSIEWDESRVAVTGVAVGAGLTRTGGAAR